MQRNEAEIKSQNPFRPTQSYSHFISIERERKEKEGERRRRKTQVLREKEQKTKRKLDKGKESGPEGRASQLNLYLHFCVLTLLPSLSFY